MADMRLSDLEAVVSIEGSELIEVSQLSTDVAITAATISAVAADNSFNDSAEGFVAAGFLIGDRVNVQGFTGDTANNLFVGTITTLTAGKMTIGGTDGDVIVDDAAGESVTIAKWTSRRATTSDIASVGSGTVIVSPIATVAYDLLNADKSKYLRLTNAAAKTITVRPNATEVLDDNAEWHFRNIGAGDATFVAGAGVTINVPAGGDLIVPQNGTVTLKRVAVDTFDLMGATKASGTSSYVKTTGGTQEIRSNALFTFNATAGALPTMGGIAAGAVHLYNAGNAIFYATSDGSGQAGYRCIAYGGLTNNRFQRRGGTAAATTNIASGDVIGDLNFYGYIAGGDAELFRIRCEYFGVNPSVNTNRAARARFYLGRDGSTSTNECMRLEYDRIDAINSGYFVNGTVAIDANGLIRPRTYTVATVPSAAGVAGAMIYVTNPAVGSARPYWSNGTNWYDAAGTLLA